MKATPDSQQPVIEYHTETTDNIKYWLATAQWDGHYIQTGWHSTKARAKKEALKMIEKEQG